jgi:hypothetical protein
MSWTLWQSVQVADASSPRSNRFPCTLAWLIRAAPPWQPPQSLAMSCRGNGSMNSLVFDPTSSSTVASPLWQIAQVMPFCPWTLFAHRFDGAFSLPRNFKWHS